MKEQPKVKMSVDMGRAFMLAEYPWYDTDMCQSSQGLVTPPNDCPSTEKIKYTLCCHALNCYEKRSAADDHDSMLELMWYTYGFVPCAITYQGFNYRALVGLRGICWVEKPPIDLIDPEGKGYLALFEQAVRICKTLRTAVRQEQQLLR